MALNPAFASASVNPSQTMGNDASAPAQGALPTGMPQNTGFSGLGQQPQQGLNPYAKLTFGQQPQGNMSQFEIGVPPDLPDGYLDYTSSFGRQFGLTSNDTPSALTPQQWMANKPSAYNSGDTSSFNPPQGNMPLMRNNFGGAGINFNIPNGQPQPMPSPQYPTEGQQWVTGSNSDSGSYQPSTKFLDSNVIAPYNNGQLRYDSGDNVMPQVGNLGNDVEIPKLNYLGYKPGWQQEADNTWSFNTPNMSPYNQSEQDWNPQYIGYRGVTNDMYQDALNRGDFSGITDKYTSFTKPRYMSFGNDKNDYSQLGLSQSALDSLNMMTQAPDMGQFYYDTQTKTFGQGIGHPPPNIPGQRRYTGKTGIPLELMNKIGSGEYPDFSKYAQYDEGTPVIQPQDVAQLPEQQPGPVPPPLAPMQQDYTNPSDFEGLTFATSMDGFQNKPMFHYTQGTSREAQLRQEAPYMTRENYANSLNQLRRPVDESGFGSTGRITQPVQQPQVLNGVTGTPASPLTPTATPTGTPTNLPTGWKSNPVNALFQGDLPGRIYRQADGSYLDESGKPADMNNYQIPRQPLATPTGTTPMATNPLSQLPVPQAAAYTPAPIVGTPSSGGGSFTQGAPLPNITTTQQQVTAAPEFYTDYLNQLAKQGASTAQNAQYVGATDLQNQAFNRTSQNVGNYQSALQNAINLAQNVGSSNLSEAIGNLGQANIARNLSPQATAGIVGSGQFGSKRGAAALGDTIANAQLGITAQQAQALQQDMQNRLAASQQLGNLASSTQQLGLGDINALATMGGQKQTIAQNEQLFPMQQLTNQSQLLRGYTIPTSTGSSYTGPIPGAYAASPLQQIAGLGALGAGISQTKLGDAIGRGLSSSSDAALTALSKLFNISGTGTPSPLTTSTTIGDISASTRTLPDGRPNPNYDVYADPNATAADIAAQNLLNGGDPGNVLFDDGTDINDYFYADD